LSCVGRDHTANQHDCNKVRRRCETTARTTHLWRGGWRAVLGLSFFGRSGGGASGFDGLATLLGGGSGSGALGGGGGGITFTGDLYHLLIGGSRGRGGDDGSGLLRSWLVSWPLWVLSSGGHLPRGRWPERRRSLRRSVRRGWSQRGQTWQEVVWWIWRVDMSRGLFTVSKRAKDREVSESEIDCHLPQTATSSCLSSIHAHRHRFPMHSETPRHPSSSIISRFANSKLTAEPAQPPAPEAFNGRSRSLAKPAIRTVCSRLTRVDSAGKDQRMRTK
jgi:hypothetical protein